MKFWEDVIHTATIGTDRKQLNRQLIPDELSTVIEMVQSSTGNKEEQFLKSAAVMYNYRRAGFVPVLGQVETLTECEPEIMPYAPTAALSVLQSVLVMNNESLLYYWLLLAGKKQVLVRPEFISALLETAEKNNELRDMILSCVGERGKWMSLFNPYWAFVADTAYAETFEQGRMDDRKRALYQWRLKDPVAAREALQTVWKQEQAVARASFLSILEANISMADEAFLREAFVDKSQKVKEEALRLLLMIPGSFIVQEVWEFVRHLIVVKKSNAMMGLMSKELIEMNTQFEMPSHFKTYGISQLDANKEFSEKEFSLSQMIGMVPPTLWEEQWHMKASRILELWDKNDLTRKYIPSFKTSANNFRHVEWALLLFKQFQIVCSSVIHLFDRETREEIALLILSDKSGHVREALPEKDTEWSTRFTISLLKKTSQEPFVYGKTYYQQFIHHFPLDMLRQIDKIEVSDPYAKITWENIINEIKKMLEIKQQIIQLF